MRNFSFIFGLLLLGLTTNQSYAQGEDSLVSSKDKYKVTKNDGTIFIGFMLKNNAREVLLRTDEIGDVYIPKHEIKLIEKYDPVQDEIDRIEGERNLLASRYVQTTNGLPIRKGEGYVKFMPVGIDFQFAITDHWSMGGMTTWWGAPMIITTKYSFNLAESVNASVGILYGNLVYGNLFNGGGAFSNGAGIGFGNITFGDSEANVNFSAGYGFTHYRAFYSEQVGFDSNGNPIFNSGYRQEMGGTALLSFAGMKRISPHAMFVFDSMISLNPFSNLFLFAPAIRYIPSQTNIFQFGIGMGVIESVFFPIPVPMLSYHKVFGVNPTN